MAELHGWISGILRLARLKGFSKARSVLITRTDGQIVIARARPEAISNWPTLRLLRRSTLRNDMIGSFECGRES